MVIVQPVPRPTTVTEYLQIRDQLIDTTGSPLITRRCDRCRVEHFTVEPCAADVPCPRCGSRRARCLRPSAHEAQDWHQERHVAFAFECDRRQAAGLVQVAPWPRTATN